MMRFIVFLAMLFFSNSIHCQTSEMSATYYVSGINSPWTIGLDYDLGFGKLFSINMQFTGGVSSQVNRSSTFGDVFLGEFQIGARLYMNKIDTWEGLYLTAVARAGIYNVPLRDTNNTSMLVIDRADMYQFGLGVYIGYKWQRKLINDMTGLPFRLVLEPYLGWTLDYLNPFDTSYSQSGAVNRLTVGLTFKIGFYTHKKSAETIAREIEEELELQQKQEPQLEYYYYDDIIVE